MSDSAIDFAIATLEAAAAELRRQRDHPAIGASSPEDDSPIAATADDTADADFPADDLLETWQASERFDVPPDTLRYWARRHGIGTKRGGRWLISISRARSICGLG